MRATVLLLLVGVGAAEASPSTPISEALRRVGPAYMCGAHFEYREALDALRAELERAGLALFMVDAAMRSVREAAEANDRDRANLTAEDCAAKYGR